MHLSRFLTVCVIIAFRRSPRLPRKRFDVQIDPFGHSATHASLLTYEAGFDAMYFGRIDGDDIARRQASLETEMVWRPSESAGPGNQIFAGAMYWSVSRADAAC